VQPVQQAVAQVVERPVQQAVQPIVQRQAVQATVQPEQSTVQRATVDAHSSEVQSRTVHTVESVAAVTAEPVRTSGTHVVESSSAPTTKDEAVIAASGVLVQTQDIMSTSAASVKDDGPPVVARPTVEAPSAPAVIREARTLSSAPTATVSAPQISLSGAVGKNVKGDYRWLGEALVDRLKALQRYPSRARLNNWQGKVILQAVIKADGHLGEVVVLKSSGHQELDAAALDTLRLACPLHMKHALGVSEVKLTVPVVYSLD
jgi:protein TonB